VPPKFNVFLGQSLKKSEAMEASPEQKVLFGVPLLSPTYICGRRTTFA
jgi:hypothetical protein